MKTSIVYLNRGDVDVILAGTCHIGKKDYFSAVEAELNKSDVVYFEGVGEDSEEMMDKLDFLYKLAAEMTDFVMQSFNKTDKWVNSDTTSEVVAQMNSNALDRVSKIDMKRYDSIRNNESAKKLFKFALIAALNSLGAIGKNSPPCTLRNGLPVLDTLKSMSNNCKKISIVYGEAHIPGIEKMLKSVGFKRTGILKLDPFKD